MPFLTHFHIPSSSLLLFCAHFNQSTLNLKLFELENKIALGRRETLQVQTLRLLGVSQRHDHAPHESTQQKLSKCARKRRIAMSSLAGFSISAKIELKKSTCRWPVVEIVTGLISSQLGHLSLTHYISFNVKRTNEIPFLARQSFSGFSLRFQKCPERGKRNKPNQQQ